MVLQKRLDYGFHGYQVPAMPRATRSVRKRGICKKVADGSQMHAFDLLATVADELLHGTEGLTNTPDHTSIEKDKCEIVNQGSVEEESSLKVKPSDPGSFVSEFSLSGHNQNCNTKDYSLPQNDENSSQIASEVTNFNKSENETGNLASKAYGGSSGNKESGDCESDGENKVMVKYELHKTEDRLVGAHDKSCKTEELVLSDQKARELGKSVSCGKMAFPNKQMIQKSSFATQNNNVKVVNRDDDENSSGCTHPVSIKPCRTVPCIRDRRIRKVSASKSWKIVPRSREQQLSKTGGNWKSMFRSKSSHEYSKRLKSQMNIPFKKRKFFDSSVVANSDGGVNSEGLSDSTGKVVKTDASATGRSFSKSGHGHHKSFQSKDSHVKIRIKSLKVPELLIEIAETATVGSLKRTVMEAVNAILGGGLRVGVLLQGKKVRDDNKTLVQTGISHDNQLDSLGFALEPNPSRTPLALGQEDSPCMLPCDAPEPLARYSPDASADHPGSSNMLPRPLGGTSGNFIESDHDSAPSPTDTSIEKSTTDSKALIAVPAMTVEALSVVPMTRKSKRSEAAQRRIRRPFSVSEVEALVQAVEKLGTGRWRDVKLRSFDNAKHRTYVDLKDKWKTLVHTARIAPQQRRGEPVPQELLDRVLAAHAYWSKQQAKYQLKRHPETCLLL